jgi:hypothetical protein
MGAVLSVVRSHDHQEFLDCVASTRKPLAPLSLHAEVHTPTLSDGRILLHFLQSQMGAVALPLGSGFAVGLMAQGDIKGW